jgi:hypothetical protein
MLTSNLHVNGRASKQRSTWAPPVPCLSPQPRVRAGCAIVWVIGMTIASSRSGTHEASWVCGWMGHPVPTLSYEVPDTDVAFDRRGPVETCPGTNRRIEHATGTRVVQIHDPNGTGHTADGACSDGRC